MLFGSSSMSSRSSLAVAGRLAAPAFAVSLLLSACAGSISPPARLGSTAEQPAYRLSAGDKLKIAVFGEDNLSGQFEVGSTGSISMPLIGELPARGLTVAELRERLATKLQDGYLKHPKLTVEVLNYRPIYLYGEVRNAGEIPYKSGMRLRDAVALAGGYTYRAEEYYVLLGRGDRTEQRVEMSGESPLLPGDNIRIPERIF